MADCSRRGRRGAVPHGGELLAAFDRCWTSADVAEGRLARIEDRPPRFTGH